MAQLGVAGAGAVVGGVVGSFVGMPVLGAQIGWALGGVAGALLFPPKGPDTQGPRLNDLGVQTSGYGVPIAVVAGHTKLSGNVIWATEVEERKTVRRQGKGGGGAKTTTFTYFQSWAVGLCEWLLPPSNAEVLRIWFDQVLVYDTTGGSEVTQVPGLVWRFYSGSETQFPDPLIEATVGAGNAPAHRGLAYIVFEDVPLERFGNRMPNVTVELVADAARTFPEVVSTAPTSSIWTTPRYRSAPTGMAVDYARGRIYMGLQETGSQLLDGIRVLDLVTLQTVTERRMTDVTEALGTITGEKTLATHLVMTADNKLLVIGAEPPTSTVIVLRVNPDTLTAEAQYGTSATGFPADDETHLWRSIINVATFQVFRIGLPPRQFALISYFWINAPYVRLIDLDSMEFVWGGAVAVEPAMPTLTTPNFGDVIICVRGQEFATLGYSDVWFLNTDGTDISVYRLRVSSGAADLGGGVAMGLDLTMVGTITPTDIGAGRTDNFFRGIDFDPSDNSLIISTSDGWLAKWSPDSGIVWATNRTVGSGKNLGGNARMLGNDYGQPAALMVQTGTGDEIVNETVTFGGGTVSQWTWDALGDAVYLTQEPSSVPVVRRVYLNRLGTIDLTVGDVVLALAERAGMDPADVDSSALTDGLRGYTLARPMSARDAITPLAGAFQFDAVEQDDVLLFVQRGGAVAATVPYVDLVREDPGAAVVEEQRAQDAELPREVNVRYADIERGWEQNAQSWRRPASPTATMGSVAVAGIDLPIPLTGTEAKSIARRLCVATWRERTRLSLAVPPKYLRLAPTDVVNIATRDGATIRCRVINTQLGANWITRLELVTEDAAVYGLTASADSGSGYIEPTMPAPYYTRLIVPDLALVADGDDLAQAGLREYAFACAYDGQQWRGVTLFRSSDAVAWDQLGGVFEAVSWGSVASMPAPPASPWTWDEAGALTVVMTNGEIESATSLEVLNGANMAALIGGDGSAEIIQYRTVTDDGGGQFTLTGLLRGRRGTEDQIGARLSGDAFVVLDGTRFQFNALVSEASALRFLRAVSLFDTIDTAPVTVTKTARGRAEKPYAVAHITGARDGGLNLTISWVRRTRLGGELLDGTGTVPVSEASEAYEVDIMDGTDVVRTITGLTSPTAAYSAADQTTDFGSAQASVVVRVYQISAIVGRGIVSEATV